MIRRAVLIACLVPASFGPAGAQAVSVTPLFSGASTAAGQPILLPSGPVQVLVSHVVIDVGVTFPVHRHPFQRYAFVRQGTLRVTDDESGAATIYRPGDFIVEMVGRWHYGTNIGTDPVDLLVIDQVPPGDQATELRDH